MCDSCRVWFFGGVLLTMKTRLARQIPCQSDGENGGVQNASAHRRYPGGHATLGRCPGEEVADAGTEKGPAKPGTGAHPADRRKRSLRAGTIRSDPRRGLRIVSVLVNPESFGGRFSAAPLASLLQAGGMGAYLVNRGDNLTAVLSQNGKQAGYYTVA